MSKLVLKQSKSIWKGHIELELADMCQHYSDSTHIDLQREIVKCPDSVVVLLQRIDNKHIILTGQWRAPLVFRGEKTLTIEACAGNIDFDDFKKGQDEHQAAIYATQRESEEETGWHIQKLEFLFALFTSPGISTEKLYYFIADVDKKISIGGGLHEEGEAIEVFEMPLEEAWRKVKKGEIVDAKTVTLLQYAIQKQSKEILFVD